MIPGEVLTDDGEIELNAGRSTITLTVANTGDRPVQVGSHYHFHEVNDALDFDRDAARGFRLDIAAGTAVRFEPGQTRTVNLVALAGARIVHGFKGRVMGPLDARAAPRARARAPGANGHVSDAKARAAGAKTRAPATKSRAPAARSGPTGAKTRGARSAKPRGGPR